MENILNSSTSHRITTTNEFIKKGFPSLKNIFDKNFINKIEPLFRNFMTIPVIIPKQDITKDLTIETDYVELKSNLSFQKVRFLLEASRLLVYSLENINVTKFKRPLIILDFNQITTNIIIKKGDKNQFRIDVLGCKNDIVFKIPDNTIFENVILCLNFQIKNSRGGKENLVAVSLRENFFKNYYISEKQFISDSLSGDLLIFKGHDCPSTCQRILTRGEYDHIALIVKIADKLLVYESTSKDGCKLRPWYDFQRFSWHILYEKMVYRKLIIKEEDETKRYEFIRNLEENLNDFLITTRGKPYRLTCNKLCCGKARDYESNNDWERCKGFFCSQLVSAGLMRLNILNINKGASYYLPGAFAESGNLDVTESCEYGPEMIIDFSL